MPRYQLRYSFEAANPAEARKMLFKGVPPLSHTIRRVDPKIATAWLVGLGIIALFWSGVIMLFISLWMKAGGHSL